MNNVCIMTRLLETFNVNDMVTITKPNFQKKKKIRTASRYKKYRGSITLCSWVYNPLVKECTTD